MCILFSFPLFAPWMHAKTRRIKGKGGPPFRFPFLGDGREISSDENPKGNPHLRQYLRNIRDSQRKTVRLAQIEAQTASPGGCDCDRFPPLPRPHSCLPFGRRTFLGARNLMSRRRHYSLSLSLSSVAPGPQNGEERISFCAHIHTRRVNNHPIPKRD